MKLNTAATAHRKGTRTPPLERKTSVHLQPQRRTVILLTQTCSCAKKPDRHVPITALLSSEAFIINRGNHRRLLIGDALVGVSEVSGVLSLSICNFLSSEKNGGMSHFHVHLLLTMKDVI